MSPNGTIRLGDACAKIGSGATPRGGKEAYKGGATTLIRSQNVYNHEFERNGLAYIDDKQASELANVVLQPGDVLLNITGDSVARCCQVPSDVLPARVNQHVAILRPRLEKLDAQFLHYVLVSPTYQARLLALAAVGATRNALTKGMLEDLEVPALDIAEQKAIAAILGALDDKIELNRRMSATLEATARALFQSWFVDFDPVRAKLDGRQPNDLDPATAALFPNEFEDSELGPIPKGWEIRSLDQIATYLNGLALQKFPPGDGPTLPVIKIAQLRQGHSTGADRCGTNVPTEYVIHHGDVLFSWSGSLEVELWCGGDGALNQHLFKVTSNEFPKWFYYFWTRYHLDDFRLIATDKATTMGHIQRKHLSAAKVLIPAHPLLDAMTTHMSPLINKIIANRVESRTVAVIRDTLLPKLLSGELHVPQTVGAA